MVDWTRIQQAKKLSRARAAALPFAKKLEKLERLRERGAQFKAMRGANATVRRTGSGACFVQQSALSDPTAVASGYFEFGADSMLMTAITSSINPTPSHVSSDTSTFVLKDPEPR